MCKSVPQMEAVRTRTSTSAGPIEGTGAFSNERPRAGCILRKAFIVEGIEKQRLEGAIAMVAHRRDTGTSGQNVSGRGAVVSVASRLYWDNSSSVTRFVRGHNTATITATPVIAAASIANTAGTPRNSTAPISNEENAALSRLQLYVNPTPVARMRVGNNSA